MTKAKKTRSINDYMNWREGRKVSASQLYGVAEWHALSEQLDRMREQCEILEKCGLDKESKALTKLINNKECERRNLEDRLNDERLEMVQAVLMCLAACDVATETADNFADTMHVLTRGLYGVDNSFSTSIREQAASFNKIVCSVDECEHEALAMFYADMAEEINAKVLPVMREIIRNHMNSPKGKKYF